MAVNLNTPEVAITAEGIKTFGPLLVQLINEFGKMTGRQLKSIADNLKLSYGPYLESTFERCTRIKTLVNSDEPIHLQSIYVQTKFKCNKRELDDIDVIGEIKKRKRAIVSGTAGGGKTIFMKFLWISFFENPEGKIPIFLELRKINDLTTDDMLSYIYHTITSANSTVTRELFDKAVKKGGFTFIFDGFDEIVVEKRSIIEKQILDLSNNNPDCVYIVSTRPDDRFDSWQLFYNYRVQPMNKPSVISLVNKLEFDNSIKKKFTDLVEKELYDKHKSFLSIPLLATLMLMTFNNFADIPEKNKYIL